MRGAKQCDISFRRPQAGRESRDYLALLGEPGATGSHRVGRLSSRELEGCILPRQLGVSNCCRILMAAKTAYRSLGTRGAIVVMCNFVILLQCANCLSHVIL